jgi:putative pyruvate formate lyase activating enzyme
MPPEDRPSYLEMKKEDLKKRVDRARSLLSPCTVCPRNCGVDRLENKLGVCKTGEKAIVSSFNPHFGEENPLVGRGGSGTIFFSHCNLKCIFCQNYEISHMGEGDEVDPGKISAIMLYLQKLGCENINFVSPTHVVPQILASLPKAMERGLRLPLVYNTGGYDTVETLRLLEGIIDIYMPDAKYSSPEVSKQLSGVEDYPQANRDALREMHRQVGDLELDHRGVAKSGLLVRHLVLPGGLSGTEEVTDFIAREISTDTYINIMDQYRPCYRAGELDLLDRSLTGREYEEAVKAAKKNGLHRLDSPKRHLFFPL